MQENYIVGIYARLSRDDERAGESVSIENQKECSPAMCGNRAGRCTIITVMTAFQVRPLTVRD